MSVYTRDTELRHVKPHDIYKLGVILNEDNCWLKLLEQIPKGLDNHVFSDSNLETTQQYLDHLINTFGRKYTNDHVHLLEDAVKRPGETRLLAQILFDEWSISGRKHERPTIGVLQHLLIKAELFRAADFVAENLLKESPPVRPMKGPGSKVDTTLPSELFQEIEEMVYDSNYYPTTGTLNSQQNNSNNDNNMDFYEKYCGYLDREKSLLNRNDDKTEPQIPKPPPRLLKLNKVRQTNPQLDNSSEEFENSTISKNDFNDQNLPKFSSLLSSIGNKTINSLSTTSDTISTITTTIAATNKIANNATEANLLLKRDVQSSIPLLSILINPVRQESSSSNKINMLNDLNNHKESAKVSGNLPSSFPLPILSALNIDENNRAVNSREEQKPLINFDSTISEHPSNTNSRVYAEDIELIDISMNNKHLLKSQDQQQRPEQSSISQIAEEEFNIHEGIAQESNHKNDSDEMKSETATEGSNNDDDNVERDDEEDDLIPNLSFLGPGSSNNDSSLTTVTGTSGDSSFDLSLNDCSSNSLDNIPNPSTTKP